ncbi:MAG: TonB-dependent receptor [Candidatus Delongbacteria bacterium]|jgi:iron complex outermembrane receptor protein|nr:TonB-dependent receptor [Candidatus Delongbacteria bacterium]
MNSKLKLFLTALLLVSGSVFCVDEDGLEMTYDAEGDSVIFTYILEEVIVNSKYERSEDYKDMEITSRDIELSKPQNVSDALKSAPDINASTGHKGETNTRIRGFSSEDILVLVDGKPINPGYYGKVDLSMIPTDNIAKIKIIKGPASVAYGTNNNGGVINIITKNGNEKPQTKLSGMFGDNGFSHINFNHSYRIAGLSYWISGYYRHRNAFSLSEDYVPPQIQPIEDGGLRNNSFYEKWGTDAKISYTTASKSVYSLSFGYNFAEKEVPYASSYTYDPRFFYFPEWYRYHGSLTGYWVLNGKADLKGIITTDSYQDRLFSYSDAEFDEVDWDSWLKNYTIGTIWSGSYVISSTNELTYGLSTLRYYLKKWNVGEPKLIREVQTGNTYAEYLFKPLDELNFKAGLSMNSFYKNSDGITDNNLGYSVSSEWTVFKGLSTEAGVSQTYRFPTMHELYSTTGGNEELDPEKCLKYELNLKAEREFPETHLKTSLEASVFLNDIEDLIERQAETDIYDNIDAKIAGIEITTETEIAEKLTVGFGYTHLEPYDWGIGMLYDSPRDKFKTDIKLELPDFIINYEFNYNGERDTEGTRILSPYQVHSAAFHYMPVKMLELHLKADNIFDENYEEEVGFPAPGRMITGGITITF